MVDGTAEVGGEAGAGVLPAGVGALPAGAVARAAGGFALAGLAVGLGASDPETALRTVPAGLVVAGGTLVLSGPALLVGHQMLGLGGAPGALVGALADGFARAGRLAAGLSPALAFFSLTTDLWIGFGALAALAIGAIGFGWAATNLHAVERRAPMDVLVFGWSALAMLVSLRLALDVADLVLR